MGFSTTTVCVWEKSIRRNPLRECQKIQINIIWVPKVSHKQNSVTYHWSRRQSTRDSCPIGSVRWKRNPRICHLQIRERERVRRSRREKTELTKVSETYTSRKYYDSLLLIENQHLRQTEWIQEQSNATIID